MEQPQLYEILREKIIWLELKPESMLNLTEMAEMFDVSRTPVTLALTRLETEGWVVRHGKHFTVSPLSLNRIKEFTEIRLLMEVQANLWAMARISPEEMRGSERLKKDVLNTKSNASAKHIVGLDVDLHHQLFNATRNAELARLLGRLLRHYLRFFLSVPSLIRQELFPELLGMIDAVEKKDEKRLKSLSIEHIKGTTDRILATM